MPAYKIIDDHTDLLSIGTKTHEELDTHVASLSNPHSVTKAQILTGNLIVNTDVDASAAIASSKLNLALISQDVAIKLSDNAGVQKFSIQDSDAATVFQVNSDGSITIGGTALNFDTSSAWAVHANNGAVDVLEYTSIGATNIRSYNTRLITLASGGGVVAKLGDAAGVYDFFINDSNDITVFQVNSDGTVTFGIDTNLYRSAANVLKTDDDFIVSGTLTSTGGLIGKITTVTDTYTILATDQTVICNKATGFTVTLPTAVVGQVFNIKNIGAGTVTVDGAGSDTIDGELTQSVAQWNCLVLQCNVANTWAIV